MTSEKITLPIKTKIAAWWMTIWGGIFLLAFLGGLILILFAFFTTPLVFPSLFFYLTLLTLLLSLCLFPPGFLLLKRKRWAWKFAIVYIPLTLLVITMGALIASGANFLLFSFLVTPLLGLAGPPYVRLLLDSKHFRKVAS